MTTFAMKGYKGDVIGANYSYTEPEITGNWHMSGARVVDTEFLKSIHQAFENDSNLKCITFVYEGRGVVYTPIRKKSNE